MFSPTFLLAKSSSSIYKGKASRRLTVRLLNDQVGGSVASPTASPSSSSLLTSSGSDGEKRRRRSFVFDFLIKSVYSGVLVVGIGSLFRLNSSTSNSSSVSFADFPKGATWTMKEEQFQYPSPNQNAKKKSKFLFGDDYRRRVFFNYEKRIRIQSRPEKVFEYFASIHTAEGEIYMTPADLMRAIVPVFPPSESNRVREGFLRGERRVHGDLYCVPSNFFMLFDTNNDGLISFPELERSILFP